MAFVFTLLVNMDVMNKSFWYSLIFISIGVYVYVGYSFSSSWKASSKYTKKITLDKYRNHYPKLSLKDNFSSYWLETKFMDKAISWVDELIKNEENFNAKLDFLSSKDLDSLLTTHKVIGYMTYQKQYLNTHLKLDRPT